MMFENYDPSFPDQPVVDLYLQIWSKLPSFKSKAAFIWSEEEGSTTTLTYGQLNESVESISSNLLSHLQRGDTLLILCPPGIELVQVIFGCQRAGILAVPIIPPNPSFHKHDDYQHFIRSVSQTKPKATIANQAYIKRVQKFISTVSGSGSSTSGNQLSSLLQSLGWMATEDIVRGLKNLHFDASNSLVYRGCKAEEVYLIQYTSGATGIPKPVFVTAGAAAHNVRAARNSYDLQPNSVIVSWLPQYHDCGLMFLLLSIVSGATCVLTSPSTFIRRPRIWLELISQYKATCTPVPSFTLPLVVRRGGGSTPISFSSMKNMIIINEPIYSFVVDEFARVFKPFGLDPSSVSPSYGLAENCTFVSTAWRSGTTNGNLMPTYKKLLPCARLDDQEIDDNINILVVSEETRDILDDGIEGEIWVASPSNAIGYLGHSSMTGEVLYARLKNRASCGRFVRTGDRGIVIGEQRYLYVTGRGSDIIKLSNGKEVHPHYLETTAYHGYPCKLRGGCLAAFSIPNNNNNHTVTIIAEMQQNEKDVRILKKICEGIKRSVFEEEAVRIGEVVLVKSGNVPKTSSGKIQRWLARENLIKGKMDVLMHKKFEYQSLDLAVSSKMLNNGYQEKCGIEEETNNNRSTMISENTTDDETIVMFPTNNYTPWLSSL